MGRRIQSTKEDGLCWEPNLTEMGPCMDNSSSAEMWDAVPVNLVCRNLRYWCKHSRQPMYFYLLNPVLGGPKSRRIKQHPPSLCWIWWSQLFTSNFGKWWQDIWPLWRETMCACLLERASSICKSTWWILWATNNFFQPPLRQEMEAPSERRWSWLVRHAGKSVAWLNQNSCCWKST